jgi:uncharacterized protein
MHLGDDHRGELRRVLARSLPAGVNVYAFGSRVHRRNLKPYSDLDLCLLGDQPVSAAVLAKLDADLEDSQLPFKVDIVDWAALSSEFRYAIAGDLTPLAQKDKIDMRCGDIPGSPGVNAVRRGPTNGAVSDAPAKDKTTCPSCNTHDDIRIA